MITFIAQLTIRPENWPAMEAILTHVRDSSLAHEPGVVYYSFARSADEDDRYAVVEVYRDAAAHAHHMSTAWVTGSLPESRRLTDRIEIAQYVTPGETPAVRRFREG